jgi:hypothetical protein
MAAKFHRLYSERGMILFISVVILSLLLMVGIGSRVMLQNDYRALSILRGATEAFYFSTAGLEWGKNEVFRETTFPPTPASRSESFGSGSFLVTFLSPIVSGPLSAKIVVRSTGINGSSSHIVEARLTKIYDLADGAVGLRGNASEVNLSGGAVSISGRDHDWVTGKPLPTAKPRAALSVGDDSLRALVEQAAANLPQGSIENGTNAPVTATGEYLPTTTVSQLAASLCGQATAILSAVPVSGQLIYENQNWGTRTTPELRCIDGLPESADGVTLAGNMTGAGILIVRNADLILTGSFRWDGLVIVTGADVSLKVIGSGVKEVVGAAVVNETGSSPGKAIMNLEGNIRIVYSRQALEHTGQLIPASILNNTYNYLPILIKQDYWRSVTP